MKMTTTGALSGIALLATVQLSPPLSAQEMAGETLAEVIQPNMLAVQHLALNPTLIRATERANEETLNATEITNRDARWIDEKDGLSLRHTVTHNRVARLLNRVITANATFTEAFLTDKRGATVAAYPPTSDYWQGDEEKFTGAFNGGDGQTLIGPVELDDSTNTYQAQISVPVIEANVTIGVLVVGIALDGMQASVAAAAAQ